MLIFPTSKQTVQWKLFIWLIHISMVNIVDYGLNTVFKTKLIGCQIMSFRKFISPKLWHCVLLGKWNIWPYLFLMSYRSSHDCWERSPLYKPRSPTVCSWQDSLAKQTLLTHDPCLASVNTEVYDPCLTLTVTLHNPCQTWQQTTNTDNKSSLPLALVYRAQRPLHCLQL